MRSGSGGTAAMLIGRQRPYTGNTSSSSGGGGGGGTGTSNTVSGAAASSSHAHNIVVVKAAAVKETGIEKDDDIVRLQVSPCSIWGFVAVSRVGVNRKTGMKNFTVL